MKFEKHFPTEQLKPFIKYFVVAENGFESEYKVFPSTGLVIGFQYKGNLTSIKDGTQSKLASAGITGITDSYKLFKNSPDIGTVLVYFTEVGLAHFATTPVHELFNLSLSLDYIFKADRVRMVEEQLCSAANDNLRIRIVEQFLLTHVRAIEHDSLIVEAVKLIYQSNGTIRIKELNEKLAISQSPFEKRFRKVVGTTPKKFASIVRFNTVLNNLTKTKTLTEICYEYNFFDQAHLTRDFKQFTGDTPDNFKRLL